MFIRSALFYISMSLSTVIFAILSMFTIVLPLANRYAFISKWCRYNLWMVEKVCKINFKIEGRENIPDHPVIIMSKHQSTWETLAFTMIFPMQVWVLKRELLWVPFFGWGLALLQPIAIDRSSGHKAIRSIVDQGLQRLKDGRWIVVFPEGTRVAPGKVGRYGIGGAVLAEQSGTDVLPVAHNAGEYWPRHSFMKIPGTVTVVIGKLISSKDKSAEQIRNASKMWIEDTMQRISQTRNELEQNGQKDEAS